MTPEAFAEAERAARRIEDAMAVRAPVPSVDDMRDVLVFYPVLVREVRRLRDLDARQLYHYAEIEKWKEATGLLRGGDPAGVTPEDLAKETRARSRLLLDLREHLTGGGDRLAGEALVARLNLFLGEDDS